MMFALFMSFFLFLELVKMRRNAALHEKEKAAYEKEKTRLEKTIETLRSQVKKP